MQDKIPYNKDYGKELGQSFMGAGHKDEELFNKDIPPLPDVKKADAEIKEGLKKKFDKIKNESINKPKTEGVQMNLGKLIGGILALLIALVFTFIYPGSGVENLVVTIAAGVLGQIGLTKWRADYDLIKAWYKSKTIIGALFVVVPIIAIALITFFAWSVPGWVLWALGALVTVGGGTSIIGIISASAKSSGTLLKCILMLLIPAAAAAYLLDAHYGTNTFIQIAALTAITGTTKTGSQKTIRQRSFSAKEAVADTAVAVPVDALKSVELKITGVNDEGAFGTNTIGQKVEGKLIVYAGDAKLRTYCHELVTKTVEYVNLTTNSGLSYTFQTADATPALVFAYESADQVTADDKPSLITLTISGYRDNLVMN